MPLPWAIVGVTDRPYPLLRPPANDLTELSARQCLAARVGPRARDGFGLLEGLTRIYPPDGALARPRQDGLTLRSEVSASGR